MTRGKRSMASADPRSSGDGVSGPSYSDVRYLLQDLEAEYAVRTQWLIDPAHATDRWKGPVFHVRLRAYKPGSKGHGDEWASASMGGSAGSATMPGAMVSCCVDMADQLQMRLEREILSGTQA